MPGIGEQTTHTKRQALLRLALRLREFVRLGDRQSIYLWAAIVGIIGAAMALLFEFCVELVQGVLTGDMHSSQLSAFTELAHNHPV